MFNAMAPLLALGVLPRAVAKAEVSMPRVEGHRLRLGLQMSSEVRNERPHGNLRSAEVSKPLDPVLDGERLGLGPQIGSYVWQEGEVSKPIDPVADDAFRMGLGPQISAHVWQEDLAESQDADSGSAIGYTMVPLSPAAGNGVGLGPQIASRIEHAAPQREDDAAEVSGPLTPEAILDQGRRALSLGPQISSRVTPGAPMSWYAYMAEWFGLNSGRYFQVALLVNILVLAVALYLNPQKRNPKQRLMNFRCGMRRRRSDADLAAC